MITHFWREGILPWCRNTQLWEGNGPLNFIISTPSQLNGTERHRGWPHSSSSWSIIVVGKSDVLKCSVGANGKFTLLPDPLIPIRPEPGCPWTWNGLELDWTWLDLTGLDTVMSSAHFVSYLERNETDERGERAASNGWTGCVWEILTGWSSSRLREIDRSF
jgi:hypothetical protein